ncbi:STY4851/ECs_5259 family protein [Desulfogranum marinum]|uniref:STY4851/ECs_5259 family protein n=1 Tax=Desulfogranum marinum TaxID=453220 RepID=UPI0029C6F8F3|nr:STY4851/ECs_5259 family protein [Desulfogranum marinum]
MQAESQRWLQFFFEKRGLEHPDGRELYRYRTEEQEFLAVETVLRQWLAAFPQSSSLAQLADDRLFGQLFVFYASEWWRRRYKGTGVAWDPILADLRCAQGAWSPQQRSGCVERGLQRWQCRVRRQGGYRFILSIALQGGLPMRLVAEGRGRLGKLLKRILHLCSDITGESGQGTAAIREQDIYGWIESLEKMLPKSFRQPVIYHLLTEIIITVLRLKTEAELTSSEDALTKLDNQVPDWRAQFPLPLEDDHAQGLIAQLLRDAAEVVVTGSSGSPFLVERSLENGEQGWRLVSSLMLQESINAANLGAFFSMEVDTLPRQINLTLSAGEKIHTARLRRIAGKNRFRMMRHFPYILDLSASRDHMMQIDLADGSSWCGLAHHGEELDEGLPWVFSAYNDHPFIKQGGGKIAETEVQLALPAHWQIEVMDENSSCQQVGALCSIERTVWKIRGRVTTCSEQGETFRFQTGRADATQTSYYWKGDPFWLDFRSPGRAFRGLPELFAVGAEGTTKKVGGKPEFTILGSKGLDVHLGPVLGQYSEGGEIQSRTRMVLLPQEARVEIQGSDAVSGTISLHHWGCNLARIVTPNVQLDVERADHSLILHTSLADDTRTPATLGLEVFWPHSTTPVCLALPYPAKGARAFSIEGTEWKSGARISLLQLLGARIVIQEPRYSAYTELVLRSLEDHSSRTFPITRDAHSTQMTVRLLHFEEEIRHMLSMSNKLDALIAVKIILDGSEMFRLTVCRYQGYLKPNKGLACLNDSTLQTLNPETLGRIRIMACNLVSEDDRVVEIEQCTSERGLTGIWGFGEEERTAGPWLLYPHMDTPIALRPLLMTVPGELPEHLKEKNGLAAIMREANEKLRMVALGQFVEDLAADYLHQGWGEVEQWVAQIGHLSLTAFDLWRAFARSATGMAALALRLGNIPMNFIRHFAVEMPFCWTTIAYQDWKQAMVNLRRQCERMYSTEIWQPVFSARIASVCDELTGEYPELQFLLGIASAGFDGNGQQVIVGLQLHVSPQAENELFTGESCKKQQLFHRHAGDEWPGGLKMILSQARNHPGYSRYISPTSHGFKDPVINLPLLLAVQCAAGKTEEWFNNPELISMLRCCRSFDPDWFADAYNMTIARCLADNILTV